MNRRFILLTMLIVLSIPFVWGEHSVVPEDIATAPEFKLASQFLNKYASLLASSPTEKTQDSLRRVKEDGFKFINGNDDVFRSLSGKEDFKISFNDGIYTAEWWSNGSPQLSCSFPANIGLLTFSSKIDLERHIIELLRSNPSSSKSIALPKRQKSRLTPVKFSDFYIEDKGFYVTPRLKHQLIFTANGAEDQCVMLIDTTRYVLESISNMMLSGYSDQLQTVNVKVSQYGYKSQKINIPLAELYTILSDEGSIPYWGVDTFDGNIVKALYVWINREGGFAHMLSVTIPIDVVGHGGLLEAKLHCYLRLDNLKSMFEEYKEI